MKNLSSRPSGLRRPALLTPALLAGIVLLISVLHLAPALSAYREADAAYDSLRNGFAAEASPSAHSAPVWTYDFDRLVTINPDAAGYLRMRSSENEKVDYPVVQGTDNSYYLDHIFSGAANASGCLFIDCRIPDPEAARNCIVYGHNMRGGARMFGCLSSYTDPDYLETHRQMDVWFGSSHYVYEVFSCFETREDDPVYTYDFPTEEEFAAFLSDAVRRRPYDMGLLSEDIPSGAHVLTLSTCLDQYREESRFVVLLVRLP